MIKKEQTFSKRMIDIDQNSVENEEISSGISDFVDDAASLSADNFSEDSVMVMNEKTYQMIQQGRKRPPLKQYIASNDKSYEAVDNSCGQNIHATFNSMASAIVWLREIHRYVRVQKYNEYRQRIDELKQEAKSHKIEDSYQKRYQELRELEPRKNARIIDQQIIKELMETGLYSNAKIRMCIQAKSVEALLDKDYAREAMIAAQQLCKGIASMQQGQQLTMSRSRGNED